MVSSGIPHQAWVRRLQEGSAALSVSLTPRAVDLFARYMEELKRWGTATNLMGFRTEDAIVAEGFLDSIACLRAIPPGTHRVLDIGSGAGFPGIPMKIARPALALTLIEANRRRHSFLTHLCRHLALGDVRCLRGRAEALAADPALAGAFDAVFARAVAKTEAAAALALGFLKAGGLFIAQQGSPNIGNLPGYGGGMPIMFNALGRKGAIIVYASMPDSDSGRFT